MNEEVLDTILKILDLQNKILGRLADSVEKIEKSLEDKGCRY